MTQQRIEALLLLLPLLLLGCGSEEGRALCEAIEAQDLEAVEALIAQGADVNEHVRFRGSATRPTLLALSKLRTPSDRREAIAMALIEGGGDPNLSWSFGGGDGSPGETIYVLAVVAEGGSVRVIEGLLDAGARVAGQPRGGAALIAAARANQVEVLRLLIDAGANIDYKDKTGDTPLGAAVKARAQEAIFYLEELGASEW
jgi:ankyrin repeat protein